MSGRPDPAAAQWADEPVDTEETEGEPEPVEPAASDGAGEETILADVAALTAQRDEYLDSLQRLKADFDNYRKRVARQQEEQSARAAADLVSKVLPVIDNLDLAWSHLGPAEAGAEPETEEARALGQARRQLLEVLGKEGLERLDAVDVPFDPTVHDAVAHRPVDADGAPEVDDSGSDDADAVPSNEAGGEDAGDGGGHGVQVDEVLRAGYRWRGQVLRPAMVRVRG